MQKCQAALAARDFQRRSVSLRPSLQKQAEKWGVSRFALKRALVNPSNRLRRVEEKTRIRRVKPSTTASDIVRAHKVKLHKERSVQRIRAPIRQRLKADRHKRKVSSFVGVEEIKAISEAASSQHLEDLRFFTNRKRMR